MTARRALWDDVLPRWEASQRALEGRATPAQRAVHGAAIYLLARWQRTTDRVYLAQLGELAGITDTRTIGRHLAALDALGALTYTPSRGGRGPGLIALPDVADDPQGCAPRAPLDNGGVRTTRTPNPVRGARHAHGKPELGEATRAPLNGQGCAETDLGVRETPIRGARDAHPTEVTPRGYRGKEDGDETSLAPRGANSLDAERRGGSQTPAERIRDALDLYVFDPDPDVDAAAVHLARHLAPDTRATYLATLGDTAPPSLTVALSIAHALDPALPALPIPKRKAPR